MIDILAPRTDGGVAIQAVFAVLVLLLAFVAVRRRPEWRLFVIGLSVVTVAGFGLRALH